MGTHTTHSHPQPVTTIMRIPPFSLLPFFSQLCSPPPPAPPPPPRLFPRGCEWSLLRLFPPRELETVAPLGREGEKRNGTRFTKSGMSGRKTSRCLARLTRFIFFLCTYGLRNLSTIIPSLSVSLPSPSVIALCNSNLRPSSPLPLSPIRFSPFLPVQSQMAMAIKLFPPYDRNITRFAKICAEK